MYRDIIIALRDGNAALARHDYAAAEAAGNLSSQPPVAGVNFTPGPDASTNPGANSTPSNGAAGATYNPDSGFNPAPAPLDAPSESQSGPPAYDPNGGFG